MADLRERTGTVRLIARHNTELQFARHRRWKRLVPAEQFSQFVFEMVLSASLEPLPFRDAASGRWIGLEEAAAAGRDVRGFAVAESMHLSNATVWRRATELVRGGYLDHSRKGYRVAAGFVARADFRDAVAADAADLMTMFAVLAEGGYRPAADALAAGCAALPPGVIGRVLLTYVVRTVENFIALYRDPAGGAIFLGIVTANVRALVEDPELARRYAAEDALPPDEMRRPIGLRALSRATGLAFETVRRRVAGLVQEEVVVWRDDGVIVPARVLAEERFRDNNRRIAGHVEQMLATLTRLQEEGPAKDEPGGPGKGLSAVS